MNLIDDAELMDLLVKAGFDRVFVGIETPDEEGLAECNKVQNQGRDLVAAVHVHAGGGTGGSGRIHRRVRQRYAFDLSSGRSTLSRGAAS